MVEVVNRRRANIDRSPKRGGSGNHDSLSYLQELGISISERRQAIQFATNVNECVHRWAPYVQGFSASFVQSIFERYAQDYGSPKVLDPFAGCGTVLVQAKIDGYASFGVELNPLLQYIADVKVNSWTVRPARLLSVYHGLRSDMLAPEPFFLKSERQFNAPVLANLKRIKGGIDAFVPKTGEQRRTKDLLNVAFAAILVDCSNPMRYCPRPSRTAPGGGGCCPGGTRKPEPQNSHRQFAVTRKQILTLPRVRDCHENSPFTIPAKAGIQPHAPPGFRIKFGMTGMRINVKIGTVFASHSKTPAMAAGIANHIWTIHEITKLAD